MLAMHSVAFDQLLPIFMHHPAQDIHSPDVKLPLKFSGGFGIGTFSAPSSLLPPYNRLLDSGRIGILFTLYGIFGMFIQFFIFPPIARKFGILNCLKVVSIFFPCIYILTPFSSLLPTTLGKEIAVFSLMLVKSWAVIFAFPCSTILLTNSASSLRILGTLNGVATSISAIGRAAGPAIGGGTFSMGVDAGYVIVPWWTLAFIAALGAIPVFRLIEMDGFGPSSSSTSSSLNSTPLSSTDSTPAPSPPSSPSYPTLRGLTRSFTAPIKPSRPYSQPPRSGSSAIPTLTEEPESSPFDDEEDFAIDDESSPALRKVVSHSTQGQPPPLKRRMSTPIGLVDTGVRFGRARRYSSNLGMTRAGYGSGGGSFVE
jgi:MFS family permease